MPNIFYSAGEIIVDRKNTNRRREVELKMEQAKRPRGRPFPKGVSGNPGGRPKTNPEVKEILKAAAPEAARKLVEMIYSENEKIAMWAITDILDRTQGKAMQMQDVSLDINGVFDITTQIRRVLLEQKKDTQDDGRRAERAN